VPGGVKYYHILHNPVPVRVWVRLVFFGWKIFHDLDQPLQIPFLRASLVRIDPSLGITATKADQLSVVVLIDHDVLRFGMAPNNTRAMELPNSLLDLCCPTLPEGNGRVNQAVLEE
jgi:hypothetical protein